MQSYVSSECQKKMAAVEEARCLDYIIDSAVKDLDSEITVKDEQSTAFKIKHP